MRSIARVPRSFAVVVWGCCLIVSLVGQALHPTAATAATAVSVYGIRQGDLRIGVVLLDLDGSPDPVGAEALHGILEGEGRRPYSVRHYFLEATRQQTRFDFDVYGPFTAVADWCSHAAIVEAGSRALTGQNPGVLPFDGVIFVTEEAPEQGCRYRGGSYQGGYQAETNAIVLFGHQQPALIVHELGHALGLKHASGLRCAGPSMTIDHCETEEYADPTDLMGHAHMAKLYYNFNAPHKIAMGTTPADEIKQIRRSGIYTIIGSETDRSGTHVLKIEASDAFGALFVEYRQPLADFARSMSSELVVTAWTENAADPTRYVASLNCRRAICDALTVTHGGETIRITALYEGTGKGKVRIELSV